MDRRRFLQVTAVSVAGAGLAACGDDGPGATVPEEGLDLGSMDEVRANIEDGEGAWYLEDAGTYLVEVPAEYRPALADALPERLHAGLDAGFLALHQKCPHQGCRVPYCESSGWFECNCHGSRFSPYGELRRGPADTGMSYLPVAIDGESLRLEGDAVDGIGDDITRVPDPGDHCV